MIGQILTLDDDDWEDYWCSLVLTIFGVTNLVILDFGKDLFFILDSALFDQVAFLCAARRRRKRSTVLQYHGSYGSELCRLPARRSDEIIGIYGPFVSRGYR